MNIIYVQEILNLLNQYMNELYAFDYDNVGLIIGNNKQIVSNIICCLDITKDVIQKAISLNANLIISHHPVIFHSLKKIIYNNMNNMNIIFDAIKNNISIIAIHTNVDCVSNGTNDLLCKKLKLKNIINIVENNRVIYKIGKLKKELIFLNFLKYLKKKINTNNLRFIQSNDYTSNIAICSGSGGSNLNHIYNNKNNIDTFVTSDIKYDVMLMAYNMNINIIDAGHYETEKFVINYFYQIINNKFPKIKVFKFEKNYIKHI